MFNVQMNATRRKKAMHRISGSMGLETTAFVALSASEMALQQPSLLKVQTETGMGRDFIQFLSKPTLDN